MNILFRFVTRFPYFRSATVDSAIKGITKAVDELNRVADQQSADIEERSQKIADLQLANSYASDQVYRANSIARRLNELVA